MTTENNKILEQTLERLEKALQVTENAVLNAEVDGVGKDSFISIGGVIDASVLALREVLGENK